MSAIETRNLSFRYGDHAAVHDVSLRVEPGEIVALVGPSGCGKTTLLKLIAGFLTPHAGSVSLGDTQVVAEGICVPAEKRRIGLVFQQASLFPHLNVEQNVLFGVKEKNRRTRAALASRWLSAIHLEHRAKAYPHQLSGGEQQRVALVRALAAEPLALLMDEPFGSLDTTLRRIIRAECMQLLRDARVPTLLVTHDAEEAMELANRVYVMQAGQIAQTGTPEQIYQHPVTPEVASLFGDITHMPGMKTVLRPEHIRIADKPPGKAAVLTRLIQRSGYQLGEFKAGEEYVLCRIAGIHPVIGKTYHLYVMK